MVESIIGRIYINGRWNLLASLKHSNSEVALPTSLGTIFGVDWQDLDVKSRGPGEVNYFIESISRLDRNRRSCSVYVRWLFFRDQSRENFAMLFKKGLFLDDEQPREFWKLHSAKERAQVEQHQLLPKYILKKLMA